MQADRDRMNQVCSTGGKFMRRTIFSLTISLILSTTAGAFDQEWMQDYFSKPQPDRFVEQVKEITTEGLLKTSKSHGLYLGFLSQIMAQNPTKVAAWLKEFENLDTVQREVLLSAAWYSDTEEARNYFKEKGLKDPYLAHRAPRILDTSADHPVVIDLFWGFYMATGKIEPIRKIVDSLALVKYNGALERYREKVRKNEKPSESEEKDANLDFTFQTAVTTLQVNCREHPHVMELCQKIYSSGNLLQESSYWLSIILSGADRSKSTPPPAQPPPSE